MRHTLAILLLVAAVGCSNPKNTKIPQDLAKIESIKSSIEKLTPEERELLSGYLMMRMIGTAPGMPTDGKTSPIPEGMTIGKAIAEQKAFVAGRSPEELAGMYRTKKAPAAK